MGCCQSTWDGASTALKTRAQEYATLVLWAHTGRRFGACPVTVRPCAGYNCGSYETFGVWWDGGNGSSGYYPYIWDGAWRNCGGCPGPCSCEPASQVWLPGPVAGISEVRVNNTVVPTSAFRVDDGAWLVRTDGGVWPTTQTMGNPASSTDDTFIVTYLRGEAVPAGGAAAAGTLACEYIKACTNQPCRLPARVTSVSRQGVTVSAEQTTKDSLSGVVEVDAWIRAVNPFALKSRPRAYNPDLPAPRVATWVG